jgi:hypothetical protein
MEYIKTQLQLQSRAKGVKPPYTGVVSGLVYTVKTTGFLSLYRGLSVTLVFSVPKAGIRFGGNAYCKQLLADEKGKLTMGKQFLAGMGAGKSPPRYALSPMHYRYVFLCMFDSVLFITCCRRYDRSYSGCHPYGNHQDETYRGKTK